MTLEQILKPRSIVVVIGAGGVGKTTVAAALGVAAACARLDTALVTVDPSRRLRDALGVTRLGGAPARVGARTLKAAGLDPSLKLSAMMLDVKGAWDTMVADHVLDPVARRRIMENAFYRSLSGRFAGADAYAALEAILRLHQAARFDLEVVDTPPASHAFDFVEGPARLARLLDSHAVRWMLKANSAATTPLALRLAGRAARFVATELERYAGVNAFSSITDFFDAAAGAVDGFTEGMRASAALMRSESVRFVLVTTAEEDRIRLARAIVDSMATERLPLAAIVINRIIDERLLEPIAREARAGGGLMDEMKRLGLAMRAGDSAGRGAAALAGYIEGRRSDATERLGRVRRFAATIPRRIAVAIAPELRVGIRGLAAPARLAGFLESGWDFFRAAERPKTRRGAGRARGSGPGRAKPDAGVSL